MSTYGKLRRHGWDALKTAPLAAGSAWLCLGPHQLTAPGLPGKDGVEESLEPDDDGLSDGPAVDLVCHRVTPRCCRLLDGSGLPSLWAGCQSLTLIHEGVVRRVTREAKETGNYR